MARWLKLFLCALGVAGFALATLPWWLGVALRPILKHWDVTYERYERVGYAQFRLHGVRYENPSIKFTAKQVQAVTPLVWLAQRLRGAEPALAVESWSVQRGAIGGLASPRAADGGDAVPPVNQSPIKGLADLQALANRLGPRVSYWLPRVQLTSGEVHGFGPDILIAQASWQKSVLTVDGLCIAGHQLAFALTPAADASITLTAHTMENEARLRLVWSGAEIKGEAALWDQPLQLAARFPAQGWLPAEASAVAENWRLPAARVKLGTPYADVKGDVRLIWRDGTFDLALNAKAAPAANDKSKAPPFVANATAHGTLRELTLTALHIDAPFATAKLTAPVTFSVDRPLSAESAQLIVQADLAKLPWLEARGKVEGTVNVTGNTAAARQTFELKFNDVAVHELSVKEAQASGVLEWPRMELTKLKVQLDETNSLETHGSVNWQTRELTGVAVQAKLSPTWFARWLPKGATWTTAEFSVTAEGPLDAPRHEGSLKLTAAQWPPLHPLAIESKWQGIGTKLEISTHAATEKSSFDLTGTLEPHGLLLTKFQIAAKDQAEWQLAAPAQIVWSPIWEIEGVTLETKENPSGGRVPPQDTASIRVKAKGGPDGSIELTSQNFASTQLQDWIILTGPGWQVQSAQATGHVADHALVFDTTLTAQIEMSPQPAQVKLVAHGDAHGIELKEFKVVESERVLTQATGRLPLVWVMEPTPHLSLDETAPLELSASTEPDSPLWATLSAYTGLQLTKPVAKINLKGTLRQPAGEMVVNVEKISQKNAVGNPPASHDASTTRWNPASGRVDSMPAWENPSGGRVPPKTNAALPPATNPGRFKYSVPEFEDLALALQFGREKISVTTFSAKLDGHTVTASGQVPMDDAGWEALWHKPAGFDWSKAAARVEITDADLAALVHRWPTFALTQGRLSAHVTLTPGKKFAGELHLTDAVSRPLAAFGSLREIKADLVLADHLITVQTMTAKLGSEPVTLDGSVTLVPGAAPRLALGLKGKNLPLVRNTGLLLRSDLDLRADTDTAGLTRLSGALTVRDCLVLANVNLKTLLPTGRRGVSRQPPYFAVAAEPFRHWPLAVEVRAPGTVRVRTTAYSGTASAHFQLGGTLGEPRAVGELIVDRGQVLFPFATFTVQQGAVRLREADPFHAMVSLNATSQRRDYQMRLEMTGELPAPNVVITSTPALESADVLLMVMTGQPPAGDTTANSSSGPRLALLGAYLGRGLFQDLGFGGEDRLEISAGEHVSRQGKETYEFEYKLGEHWSLLGEYDQFDSYNAGVKWRVYTQESKPLEKK